MADGARAAVCGTGSAPLRAHFVCPRPVPGALGQMLGRDETSRERLGFLLSMELCAGETRSGQSKWNVTISGL